MLKSLLLSVVFVVVLAAVSEAQVYVYRSPFMGPMGTLGHSPPAASFFATIPNSYGYRPIRPIPYYTPYYVQPRWNFFKSSAPAFNLRLTRVPPSHFRVWGRTSRGGYSYGW